MRLRSLVPVAVLVVCAPVVFARCGSSPSRFDVDSGDPDTGVIGDETNPFQPFDGQADAPVVPVDKCHVPPDNGNGSGNAPTCTKASPPNSFTPKTKWSWSAPPPQQGGGIEGSIVTPLVAEMVDTDKNGEINLCDIPSVIVAVNGGPPGSQGDIYMLAGDTGKVQFHFDGNVDASVNPALGDIDGDGISEVIANDVAGHLVAYDNKGKVKWVGKDIGQYKQNLHSYCHAIAIYDLDGDGKPEIIAGFEVFDNKGNAKFHYDVTTYDQQGAYWCPANTAADLDGDGKQEVIFGNAAYHADGTVYWKLPNIPPGQPQVADLDKDGTPEIFLATQNGLMILSNDGKILMQPVQSFDPMVSPNCWSKAGAIGDFDGTGHPSLMDGSCAHFGIWHVTKWGIQLQWSAPIDDPSGVASSTAFDFLGRGVADAVYGDQSKLWVYDGKSGKVELTGDRSSGTLIEYPVVADVDNDSSADIVVVSNKSGGIYKNTVEVFQDTMKRWIPTRRIWNQHAYHITNVREDGTIPAHPQNSWTKFNTFRMNAQVESGVDCAPAPPNPN